jgi:DNA-binding protein HU-beta
LEGITVKKNDLAAIIGDRFGLGKRDAVAVVDTVFNEITRALAVKNGSVAISGFGTFKRKDVPARKARPGRNPFTGENIIIKARPASSKPAFSATKVLKEVVSGKAKPAAAPKATAAAAKPAAKPAKKAAAKKAAPKKAAAKKVVKKAAPKKAAAKKAAPKKAAKKAPARKPAAKKAVKKTTRRK